MKSRNRMRCTKCQKDFKPYSNSKLSLIRIPYSKWLSLIELSVSAKTASEQVHLSYKTTLKAFDTIRYSILEELSKSDKVLKGKIEADEAYFGGKRKGNRGRGAKNKTIVFGILERNGKVHVEIVNNVKAKTLLASTIRKIEASYTLTSGRGMIRSCSMVTDTCPLITVRYLVREMCTQMELRGFGVLPKRTWQSITVLVQESSCCTSKRWNGGTTIEIMICLIYC